MPRIIVIDDQPDVRAMISIVLRIRHFEVVEAASGAAGLREFENSRFDLAIVDIFLQGTNGFDLISMMRERVPDFPIVAISGMTTFDFVSGLPELSNVIACRSRFVRTTSCGQSKPLMTSFAHRSPQSPSKWRGLSRTTENQLTRGDAERREGADSRRRSGTYA